MDEDVVIKDYDDEPEIAEEPVVLPEKLPEPEKVVEQEKDWRHQAFHEEREKRKEIQAELAKVREQSQKMEERLQTLIKKKDEPPVPTYEENPGEFLKHETHQIKTAVEEISRERQATMEQFYVQQEQNRFIQDFESVETEYAAKASDYYEAVEFLKKDRVAEYISAGYNPQNASYLAQRDAFEIANNARQSGKNGAEIFHNLAKKRGFKAKLSDKSEIEQLKELAESKETSTTLGTLGSGSRDVSLADLAAMSDEDFDKATSGDLWRKLWK